MENAWERGCVIFGPLHHYVLLLNSPFFFQHNLRWELWSRILTVCFTFPAIYLKMQTIARHEALLCAGMDLARKTISISTIKKKNQRQKHITSLKINDQAKTTDQEEILEERESALLNKCIHQETQIRTAFG